MWVCPKQTLQNSKFLTTYAGHIKFSGWANKKKRFPIRGSPKLKLFNLLKWIHEMVVHKFSIFLFEATFAFLHHQLLPKGASPVRLDCERIKNASKW